MSSSPGQLLKQKQWWLTLSLKPRDKTFPPATQSQHPLLLLTPKAPSAVTNEKQLSTQPNCTHSLGGISVTTPAENGTIKPFNAGKKYLMLPGWSYSTNIFLLCLAREVFLSVSGTWTEPSTSPPQHFSYWSPGAKCKPSVCHLFYRLQL